MGRNERDKDEGNPLVNQLEGTRESSGENVRMLKTRGRAGRN